jgi:vitamin B12 transporter
MPKSILKCSAAIVALSLTHVASAQRLASGEVIVTATRSEQPADETGQAITIINKSDIERLQSQTVADLLQTTLGVTVTRDGGIGQTTSVRIRGAEGDQTVTLIDGIRLEDSSAISGNFNFSNLLIGNIDRIEILRGADSVAWGSRAIGGVVNIITAKPTEQLSGAVRAEYGYKNNRQLVGQVGGIFGAVSASFGGGYFVDDGISVRTTNPERDGYRQYGANGKIGLAISDTFSIDLRGYYADSRTDYDGFSSILAFNKTRESAGYAGLNLALFEGGLKNRFSVTVTDTNRDFFDPPTATAPAFFGQGRSERLEYQGEAIIGESLRAVFGVEREYSKYNDGFNFAKSDVNSAYGQLILNPVTQITLTGGLRYDDHSSFGGNTSLSANAAWRPLENTVIRASYAEGFRAPSLYQLFDGFSGTPTLKPETAKSYDVGIEQHFLDGALDAGITAFKRDTKNQIAYDDVTTFTYFNLVRARAKGIEAFINARPSETVAISLNYTLTDGDNRQGPGPFLRALRRPVHSLNAAIDWQAASWFKLGASVRLASDSVDLVGFPGSRVSLDGYAVAGLRAAVPISDTLEFYGRVDNLFDTKYEIVRTYNVYGRNAHFGVRTKF